MDSEKTNSHFQTGFERLTTQMRTSELTSACCKILQLLLHTVKLFPQVSKALKPAVLSKSSQLATIDTDNYHWSDVSELWFLTMQG